MTRLSATLVALSAALGVATTATAQVTVTMRADRTRVAPGEQFSLQIRAEVTGRSARGIQLPDLSAFDTVGHRYSRPLSFSIGTGGGTAFQRSTEQHNFALRARQAGTFQISPAVVEAGGQRYESQPLTIIVGDGGSGGSASAAANTPPASSPGEALDGMTFDPEAFLRTRVDEGRPVVGQQITVSVYLYTRGPLRSSPAITQEPTTEGFWVRNLMDRGQPLTPSSQEVGGVRFNVYLIRRFAAFPLRAGPLSIGPTAIEVRNSGIFDLLGGGSPSWSRAGVPVAVDVEPLPEEGRPAGEAFVGQLELQGELDRTAVVTGDAVTLTLTARGQGLLSQLTLPRPSHDGLRVLQPEIRDQLENPGGVVGGVRTVRYLLVPEQEGEFPLGPFEIAVFDPATERWTTATTGALTLTAAGNRPTGSTEPAADEARTERSQPSPESSRFRPIHTRSALARDRSEWIGQPWFLLLFGIGPLALLFGMLSRAWGRRRARLSESDGPKRARRAAKKKLAEARELAKKGESASFYAEVSRALKEVLEARLGEAVGSLTHAELRRRLEERGMEASLSLPLVDEIEGCEFARFSAAGSDGDEMLQCVDRARALLNRLEGFSPTEIDE